MSMKVGNASFMTYAVVVVNYTIVLAHNISF